jgi:pantetheine-phosphate adenylyltransferase
MISGGVLGSPVLLGCAVALLSIVAAISILVFRVVFPTIISHPWSIPPKDSRQSKFDKKSTVVLAGSFNPPHLGHLVMIRYLADRYGRVICCIGVNPNKTYDVTPQSRAEILREMLSHDEGCKNITVEVVSGYIWRFARTQNVSLFFRGIRTWDADGGDERTLQILNTWGPLILGWIWPMNTIFLEGDPRYIHVSSTLVRQMCARRREAIESEGNNAHHSDEELTQLVPEIVASKVAEVYGATS